MTQLQLSQPLHPVILQPLVIYVSQSFNDGSWVKPCIQTVLISTSLPWLTGKHGTKYAETTINSDDHLSLEELQLGFTSTFGNRYGGGTLSSQQSH